MEQCDVIPVHRSIIQNFFRPLQTDVPTSAFATDFKFLTINKLNIILGGTAVVRHCTFAGCITEEHTSRMRILIDHYTAGGMPTYQ